MYSVRTRDVSLEMKDYIRKYFIYKDGVVERFDKKKHSTGSLDRYGYLIIKIKGVQFKAHQIVWFLNKGEFSDVELDHINRNKLDNRIENLRQATRELQVINIKRKPNIKTNVIGIYYDEHTKGLRKKYAFKYKGKTYRFYTLEDAVKEKEKIYGSID